MIRGLAYLLAIASHLIGVVVGGLYLGHYLDRHYPQPSFSWIVVTGIIVMVIIGHNYYVFIRYMLRQEERRCLQRREQEARERHS